MKKVLINNNDIFFFYNNNQENYISYKVTIINIILKHNFVLPVKYPPNICLYYYYTYNI